jgi:hypothetical protein
VVPQYTQTLAADPAVAAVAAVYASAPRRFEGQDVVEYALRSGRIGASGVPRWRSALAAERREVRASGGAPGPSRVEREILALYPFHDGGGPAASTPTLGEYDAMFPPLTVEEQGQRWAIQDERDAAVQAARDTERDQVAASRTLTDAEYRSIFGD